MLKHLKRFLALAVGASEATITGIRRPLGCSQIVNATLASSTGIVASTYAPPANSALVAGYAIVQCNGGVVRWRDDGTAPTAAVGMTIKDGGELDYAGDPSALRFISSSGTPILDVAVYA